MNVRIVFPVFIRSCKVVFGPVNLACLQVRLSCKLVFLISMTENHDNGKLQ